MSLPPCFYLRLYNSSLVRHLPKTYSTKCPLTSPGANICVEKTQLQSNTWYTICNIPPGFDSPRTGVISLLRLMVRMEERQEWLTGEKTNLESKIVFNQYQVPRRQRCNGRERSPSTGNPKLLQLTSSN